MSRAEISPPEPRRRRSGAPPARRPVDPARLAAWRVLRAVAESDAYANLALPGQLRAARLSGRDAAFATELCYGTLRGQGCYDVVIAACTDRPIGDIDPPVLDALRLGAHQLLAMRVPAHAAVAATVDLIRAQIGAGTAGFVNAVLRRVSESDRATWLDRLAGPSSGLAPDEALALTTSHPAWVVRALRESLTGHGRPDSDLAALLAADNEPAAVAMAALPGLVDPEDLIAEAHRLAGPEAAAPGRLSPRAVLTRGAPEALTALPAGRARVQDEGSQVLALALTQAPLSGADQGRWLDLCAGPGGKAAMLAAVLRQRREHAELPEQAQLVANELGASRAGLVATALTAVVAGTRPAVAVVRHGDARDLLAEVDRYGGCDRVLVDAPCTGLGALRRRPESRWRRTPGDLARLAPLQRDLLSIALQLVRPGGVVGYLTCSPHPAETRFVVQDVIRGRADVERLDAAAITAAVIAPVAGAGLAADLADHGPDAVLWPHRHGCDGLYLALLRRRG